MDVTGEVYWAARKPRGFPQECASPPPIGLQDLEVYDLTSQKQGKSPQNRFADNYDFNPDAPHTHDDGNFFQLLFVAMYRW
jgi:hypothetical protein